MESGMNIHLRKLAVVIALLFASVAAHAELIDFTDAAIWGGINSSSETRNVGDLSVTLNSLQDGINRPLNFNPGGLCFVAGLSCDGGGIGLGSDGEISFILGDADNLEVLFDQPVVVTGYVLLNLLTGDVARLNFGREGPNTLLFEDGSGQVGDGSLTRTDILVSDFTDIHLTALAGVGYTLAAIELASAVPEPVTIDIKPGSDTNCFNINGHGVIPVAVLSSASFDAADIDVTTLSFGGLDVRVRGNKGPLCSLEDVNDDGLNDLVCQFQDNPEYWDVGEDEATLSGALLDGTEIEGTDSICIVP
jgi:hypothetical protein